MKEIKTLINEQSAKEFLKGNLIVSIVGIVVSFVIIALYVVFGITNHSWLDFLQIILVVLGATLLVISIIMIVNYLSSILKMKNFTRTVIYTFSDTAITYDIYRNDEKVESGRTIYNDLIEYRETKNYIYLRQRNNTWLILNKEQELLDFINTRGIPKFKSVKMNKR